MDVINALKVRRLRKNTHVGVSPKGYQLDFSGFSTPTRPPAGTALEARLPMKCVQTAIEDGRFLSQTMSRKQL